MNTNMKHHAAAGSVLLLAAILASACGQKDSVDQQELLSSNEPVELAFYGNGGIQEEQFQSQFGSYIKEKMRHVTVKYILKDKNVPLSDMVASGSADIDIFIDSIGQIGLKGSLIDLGLHYDISN